MAAKETPLTGTLDETIAAFRARFEEAVGKDNGAMTPQHPASLTFICTCDDSQAGFNLRVDILEANVEGKIDGYGNALLITRDLLFQLTNMNQKYGLGLDMLPVVIAQHPLLANIVKAAEKLAGLETTGKPN